MPEPCFLEVLTSSSCYLEANKMAFQFLVSDILDSPQQKKITALSRSIMEFQKSWVHWHTQLLSHQWGAGVIMQLS